MKHLTFLLTLAILTSCSLQNDLQDMKRDTGEMKGQISDVNNLLNYSYFDQRAGASAVARQQMLKSMNDISDIEAKISLAAQYFLTFEFQLWKNSMSDDLAKRQELLNQGVMEFFKDIHPYIDPKGVKEMDMSVDSKDNGKKNLYALSIVLHVMNSEQLKVANDGTLKPVSFLTTMTDALGKLPALNSGALPLSKLTPAENAVLDEQQTAEYLLKLRYNFLSAVVLSRISNIVTANLLSKILMKFFPWDVNFSGLNIVQISNIQGLVDTTTMMRTSLKKLGLSTKLDGNLKGVLGHMRIKSKDIQPDSKVPRQIAINRLAMDLNEFQDQIGRAE